MLKKWLQHKNLIVVVYDGSRIIFSDGLSQVYLCNNDKLNDDNLAKLFQDNNKIFIFPEAKTALKKLMALGVEVKNIICLKTLSIILNEDLVSQIPNNVSTIDLVNASIDCFASFIKKIKKNNLNKLAKLENLIVKVFLDIEKRGVFIDHNKWNQIIADYKIKAQHYKSCFESHIKDYCNTNLFGEIDFNINNESSLLTTLSKLLKCKITSIKDISNYNHPAIKNLKNYRETNKIVSTYASFTAKVDKNNRLHASFDPLGTSSGRISCHSPNLQNIPTAKQFRSCFTAPKGKSIITADYANCELRVLAALAGDRAFIDLFNKDADIHSMVASQLFNKNVSRTINPNLRKTAKIVNFGIIYGMGAKNLANTLNISPSKAQDIMDKYFDSYPQIKTFQQNTIKQAIKQGFVSTLLGRKFIFKALSQLERAKDSQLSRIAKNMPVQGTSAEIVKLALLKIHKKLLGDFKEAYMVNVIHDEIVIECLTSDIDAIMLATKQEMINAHNALLPQVKAKVDISAGSYWSH